MWREATGDQAPLFLIGFAAHREWAGKLREVLAIYQEAEDLITIGAYAKGSSPKIDYAIGLIDAVNAYLCQQIDEPASFADSLQQLRDLFAYH